MELAILMSIAAIAGTVWYVYKRQKRTIAIAFEEAGKIAGLPLVILQQGERSFCFLIDSGSNRSHISTEFLNDIEVKLHEKGIKIIVNPHANKNRRQPNMVQTAFTEFFNQINGIRCDLKKDINKSGRRIEVLSRTIQRKLNL